MEIPSHIDFIAVGASAGGVEALGALLSKLPPKSSVAMAIVLHMPPDRPSLLAELFSERCALPVKEAEDKERIEPGHIYIAPPNYHLMVEPDYSLSLSVEDAVLYSRPSIDLLLESAAFAYADRVLGVVLTGASNDGAQGLARIRERGGLAWVQDPATARARTMPQAAIDQAGADRILELNTLASDLASVMARTN